MKILYTRTLYTKEELALIETDFICTIRGKIIFVDPDAYAIFYSAPPVFAATIKTNETLEDILKQSLKDGYLDLSSRAICNRLCYYDEWTDYILSGEIQGGY